MFGWFLDTDLHATTGQPHNDIGSDFDVQVAYTPGSGWTGQVFDTAAEEGFDIDTYEVNEGMVSMWLPLSALGGPSAFHWIAITLEGDQYRDIAPNEEHVESTLP